MSSRKNIVVCRCVWPNGDDGDDVVFCVVYVVLMVVMVVICCCCDGVSHGEILVALSVLAGCNGGSCVVIFVV